MVSEGTLGRWGGAEPLRGSVGRGEVPYSFGMYFCSGGLGRDGGGAKLPSWQKTFRRAGVPDSGFACKFFCEPALHQTVPWRDGIGRGSVQRRWLSLYDTEKWEGVLSLEKRGEHRS